MLYRVYSLTFSLLFVSLSSKRVNFAWHLYSIEMLWSNYDILVIVILTDQDVVYRFRSGDHSIFAVLTIKFCQLTVCVVRLFYLSPCDCTFEFSCISLSVIANQIYTNDSGGKICETEHNNIGWSLNLARWFHFSRRYLMIIENEIYVKRHFIFYAHRCFTRTSKKKQFLLFLIARL